METMKPINTACEVQSIVVKVHDKGTVTIRSDAFILTTGPLSDADIEAAVGAAYNFMFNVREDWMKSA